MFKDLQDEPKLKQLYDKAELHTGVSVSLMDRVRSGKHVYIHRKTNLLFLLKREFQRTNSCDFSLGTSIKNIHYKYFSNKGRKVIFSI